MKLVNTLYIRESLMKAMQVNDFDNASETYQDPWDLGNYFEAMSVMIKLSPCNVRIRIKVLASRTHGNMHIPVP